MQETPRNLSRRYALLRGIICKDVLIDVDVVIV